jgi:hypothetical protein
VIAIDDATGLLTKRSIASISSGVLSFSNTDRIPHMNAGTPGTDFDYDGNFTYDGTYLTIGIGGSPYVAISDTGANAIESRRNASNILQNSVYHTTASSQNIVKYSRYGGTIASPLTAPSNVLVHENVYEVYDGTLLRTSGGFSMEVDGAIATDNFDTQFHWDLKDGASASATKMTLHSSGYLDVLSNATNYHRIQYNWSQIVIGGSQLTKLGPHVVDGASAIAYVFDTENALSTAGAKLVSIGNNGTELAFIDKDGVIVSPEGFVADTGTTYTFVLTDAGKIVTLSDAAAIALTVPTNASVAFPIGTTITIIQIGAGQVTIGGAGITFRSADSALKTRVQYSSATLIKTATDTWYVIGDLTV